MSFLNFKRKTQSRGASSSRSTTRRTSRPVASSKMPANAKNTTARKAYYTALASERKTFSQRMNERAGSWASPKTQKTDGPSSLKIAGMQARERQRRQAFASSGASTAARSASEGAKVADAFRAKKKGK